MVAGYTSLENNERKHFPGSFLHPNKFFLTNKLLSAYIFTFCFFCDGQSSMGSSLSQPVRDNSGHSPDSSDVSPDSSDAASVANVLDGTDAAESGGEPSGADAAGGAGECAIAGGSCGDGLGTSRSSHRIPLMHGKYRVCVRGLDPHPPTGYTSPVHGCEA